MSNNNINQENDMTVVRTTSSSSDVMMNNETGVVVSTFFDDNHCNDIESLRSTASTCSESKRAKQRSWGTETTVSSRDGDANEEEDNDDDDDDSESSESTCHNNNSTNIDISNVNKRNSVSVAAQKATNNNGHTRREHLFVVGVGILLSFNSGYVNGSCLSGLLTSNHLSQSVAGFTGAYTISALSLANGNYAVFGYQIEMILSFIFGSCISGFLTPNAKPYQIAPTYGPTFLIGGIFLTTASILSAAHVEKYYFFYLAAAANGVQNGISSLYSANLIRSTHLTGTSTDIGLFVGQYLRGNKTNLWKLRVLLSLATSFWLGGLVSFYATSAFTSWSLLFNAGLFIVIGISLIAFLVLEYHISAKAALLGTWQWHNALEQLSTLSSETQLTTSMMNVFDIVDTDKSGNINGEKLYNALKSSGLEVNMKDTERMMKFADKDGDGLISRDEWRNIVSSCRPKDQQQS